ncbi:MAG: AAA family ATPase [Phycisphaerae bacterium]
MNIEGIDVSNERDDFFADAEQDARLREVSRMVPTRGPLNDHMRREIREALVEFMQKTGLTQGDVAKAVGSNATHLSNLLGGGGGMADETRDQLWRDVNNWLDRESRAREAKRGRQMVNTRVADEMVKLSNKLRARPDMAFVEGPAGVGKTFCSQEIAVRHNAAYCYVDPDCASPSRFLRELYNSISRKRKAGRVELAEIVEKLRMPERVATVNLVIIDQAHELNLRSLRMCMSLHDRAQCSIMFVGTSDLRKPFDKDRDPLYGQLSSRVGFELNLSEYLSRDGTAPPDSGQEFLFTAADIAALFDSNKIKLHRDAIEMLVQLANYAGKSLRSVMRVAYHAEQMARARGAVSITAEFVEAAMRRCRELPRRSQPAAVYAEQRRAKAG